MSMLPYQHGAVKVCIIDVIAACEAVQFTPPGVACCDMTCSKMLMSAMRFNMSCSYHVGVDTAKSSASGMLRRSTQAWYSSTDSRCHPRQTGRMTMAKALSCEWL